MQASTYFPKVRRMLLFHAPFFFNTLLASFHAASRAPCSCHSVWDRSSNFGALGLRSWGSPGQICPSEGFWSRMYARHATTFVNFTRRKNTGWLVTWECSLRTDSASWKSLESFIQLISFCNSWILAVNSKIVSRSSTNFLLECIECRPLKSLQFLHLIETFDLRFTKFLILFQ